MPKPICNNYASPAGWNMYHGKEVPGFPAHPHRGFETVTVVLQGTVDHTDGLGSSGRYADGDVQWMTAGKGLQHAEMFPLVKKEDKNTLELFQIWLSLYGENRMSEPDYKMLWNEDIPNVERVDENGKRTKIKVVAGQVDGKKAPSPTLHSWAYDPKNNLSIHLIEMEPGASYTIAGVSQTLNRSIYFYEGEQVKLDDTTLDNREYAFVSGEKDTVITNIGKNTGKILLLEAEPMPEAIIAYGPFVMSSEEGIRQAYNDYRETEFGGWPFPDAEAYHSPDQVRYAKYGDGRVEYPAENVK